MHATMTLHEEDDPRASTIEDHNGIPFLVIGQPGSLGGLTVELTEQLIVDLDGIMRGLAEDEDARSRDADRRVEVPRIC